MDICDRCGAEDLASRPVAPATLILGTSAGVATSDLVHLCPECLERAIDRVKSVAWELKVYQRVKAEAER
jgi:hypothetical protein